MPENGHCRKTQDETIRCWKKPENNSPTWKSALSFCGGVFDFEGKQKRVAELDQLTSQPEFWNDGEKAQSILKEQSSLRGIIDSWEKHKADLAEARFFLEVAKDEKSEEDLRCHRKLKLTHYRKSRPA